ncbi:MAG: hypothetical protein U0230_28105 [Polyangiales bacterium]
MARDRKTILDFRSPAGPKVVEVRSTLITSSLTTLKDFGLYERYLELVPSEHRERILGQIAPEWMPIEVGLAHYGACDALGLSDHELERIGEAVSGRLMGTYLGTLVRSSRNVGASPWIPLQQFDKIWGRILNGGTPLVEETGPKDAIVTTSGCPLFAQRYFRVAYTGVVRGSLLLFSKTVLAKTARPNASDPNTVQVTLSWV